MAKAADDTLLKEALECFGRCEEVESENRKLFTEDIKFARLSKQWPDDIERQRLEEGRPCLTINKVAPVIRQVVNDARLNRPAITVRPVDGSADKETAEIITGLVRNIEQSSDADTAYDTAIDNAVSGGFGYFRINLDYANDVDPAGDLTGLGPEAFEKDIVIQRVVNSLSVYGDPDSTAATSEDWNVAFEFEDMKRKVFEKRFPKASLAGFHGDDGKVAEWISDNSVRVAKYWKRTNEEKAIVAVAYPEGETAILALEDYEKRAKEIAALGGEALGPPRTIPCYKVKCYLMTGCEILETEEWPGSYIPIIPVYGDEVYSEGKRHLRSIIRDAKDPNRMFNYWRTTTTELIALAPKAPWVGRKDAFKTDPRWNTANTASHAFLEYDGPERPERQPFSGVPAGALQEALSAADDVKATTGIYDASLGAPSNETSGKAITARQREGDVSSFHFIDNLSRSIRHAGRVILDLIPKVYSTPRMIRTLGPDGETSTVPVNGMQPPEDGAMPVEPPGTPNGPMPPEGAEMQRVYDLRVGRYDLAVKAGPSFSTQREENREVLIEAMQAGGDEVASVLLPRIAKLMDMPDSDEIAAELQQKFAPQQGGGVPPELQEQIEQGMQRLQELEGENQQLKNDQQAKMQELELKGRELEIKAFEAETARIQAQQPTIMRSPSTQQGTA